jgi:hypothetical protein
MQSQFGIKVIGLQGHKFNETFPNTLQPWLIDPRKKHTTFSNLKNQWEKTPTKKKAIKPRKIFPEILTKNKI